MNPTNREFDSDEYLHLAIEAVGRNDHGTALAYLKEGVLQFPQDARLAYMLGAENAQIGLLDRAEEEMQRAIQLDPNLHTARFQLGLLQMTRARPEAAAETWSGLAALPEGHALRRFQEGLLALAADRFDEARAALYAGIEINDFSPDLNRDMEQLIQRLPAEGTAAETSETAPIWFQAYGNPEQPN